MPLLVFALFAMSQFSHDHSVVAVLFGVLALLVYAFFKEPERLIPPSPLGVVAPLSGRIVSIGDGPCSVLDRKARAVRIKVDPFGGYAMRAPVEGVLREPPKGVNGCPASWIHTDEGDDIALRVASGSLLGQKPLGLDYGRRVGHGRRGGARRFALEVELLIPADSRIEVHPGDRVVSGESIIAHLPSRSV